MITINCTRLLIISMAGLLLCNSCDMDNSKTGSYDSSRIVNAMAKASRGEPVTIGVIGGSITAGYAATTENKRWANLMTDWWKKTFTNSKITLINAGFGGTGSAIADFRVQDELLKYNPDFVVIEFAVNDSLDSLSTITMEGLVRQIMASSHGPGIMMLNLMLKDGTSAVNYHKPVADHYHLPFINYSTLINPQLEMDKRSINNLYKDEVHPNDTGMNYIAQFLIAELSKIYRNLPSDKNITAIDSNLPPAYTSDIYAFAAKYTNKTLLPVANNGWINDGSGWSSDKPGTEINFNIEGNAIGVLYNLHNNIGWGKAELWVDNGEHKTIDAYWTQTWGPATVFCQIAENLSKGNHILHAKISSDCSNGTGGHYFPLLNVLKAGK
jgi:acyl-CoA thioesterase I